MVALKKTQRDCRRMPFPNQVEDMIWPKFQSFGKFCLKFFRQYYPYCLKFLNKASSKLVPVKTGI